MNVLSRNQLIGLIVGLITIVILKYFNLISKVYLAPVLILVIPAVLYLIFSKRAKS